MTIIHQDRSRARWSGFATAAAALAILTAVVVGWRAASPRVERLDRDLAELAASIDESRAGEGRFWAFPYRAIASPRRSGGVASLPPDVRLATARIEKALGDDRSARSLHNIGVAFAIEGRFDDSINALTESSTRAPGDPSVWTDLAASFLARSRPDDLSGASDAAQRALTLSPSSNAARFNRALALERLHLDREAVAEWERYARDDPRSPWASEARVHAARLAQQRDQSDWTIEEAVLREALHKADRPAIAASVKKFPQQARELVLDTLVPEWAKRPHPSSEAPTQTLREILPLAEAVAARGDRLALDAVRAILSAPSAEVGTFAAAHLAFASGRVASGEYRYDAADLALADAERRLAGRSPVTLWATMLRAIVVYQHNDLAQARDKLLALRAAVGDAPYPALLAQIDWALGVISGGQGDFTGALDRYQSALASLEQIGEVENLATVQSLLAETTRVLGDVKGSWALQVGALSHLQELRRPQRKQTIVMMAGQASLRQGRPSAALDFQNRFVDAAREIGTPISLAEALLYRARVYRQIPDPALARADLEAARVALHAATEKGVGAFITAQIQLEEARTGDPSDAHVLQGLTDALNYFRSSSRAAWLPRTFLARARLLLQRGASADAAADLLAGIETLETQRKTVSSESLRVSYFDETWDLFDEMIALQLDLGRQREAFAFAERSRARSLLDAMGDDGKGPLDPAAVAAAMPANTMMLYFASAKSHAIVWVLGSGAQQCVTLTAGPEEIDRLSRAYRRELEARHDAAATELSAALYRAVIQPVEHWLSDGVTLVISPDRAMHQVPFAALRARAGGEFLVQRHPLAFAPSARLFLRPAAARAVESTPTALVIGNPSADPSADLPSLPGAEQEAEDVAAFYPNATKLVRASATRDRFMTLAPTVSVLHIAAHALANEEFPDLSRLFLAPAPGASGVVTVSDLGRLTYSKTKLVVLAACGTAAGATFRGEGVTSLARPFLAKGVPQVVGTLWQIDDQTSRRLFTTFHRGYAQGLSAAAALQQAQMSIVGDSTMQSPDWAAIVLLGSVESVMPMTSSRR